MIEIKLNGVEVMSLLEAFLKLIKWGGYGELEAIHSINHAQSESAISAITTIIFSPQYYVNKEKEYLLRVTREELGVISEINEEYGEMKIDLYSRLNESC